MAAPTYRSRWPRYAKQWDAMERTRLALLRQTAKRLFAHKERYVAVEQETGVPWYMIACIHYSESDIDFTTQLAQGDPLNRKSTHVPAGMGPYFGADAWERAAYEALEHDGLDRVKDWRLEKIIYYWEDYNGWGYYQHGVNSAYVWAGSNQYAGGKYISDGRWSSTAVDQQLGCAPILKTMMELDASIAPARETVGGDIKPPELAPEPTPLPPSAPAVVGITVTGNVKITVNGATVFPLQSA